MNYQSIIIFAEQKTPFQCSMDRFSKEPSLGFNEQRRWRLIVHAKSTRYSWRFTNGFNFSEKPLRFCFLNSGSITVTSLSPHSPLHLPALSLLLLCATSPWPTPLLLPPAVRAGAKPGSLGGFYQLRICQQQLLNPSGAGVPCHQGMPLLTEAVQALRSLGMRVGGCCCPRANEHSLSAGPISLRRMVG